MARGASPHRGPSRAGSPGRPPGALNGTTMNKAEFRNEHEREAIRLRNLIATATTPALKARLLEEAEKHEQLAEAFKPQPELRREQV